MKQFIGIVQNIFKVPKEDVVDTMSPETIADWDSMNYLLFISELEKQFNVQFTITETMEAKNLGDIKNYLRNKGVAL
jgi:acyl carrier protein